MYPEHFNAWGCERQSAFASFDIEADGNNPMQHSMRSIGVVLFKEGAGLRNYEVVDSFYVTVSPRPECTPEAKCMTDFWAQHPDQWEHVNKNPVSPPKAMACLSTWLFKYGGTFNIKWVASPSNFDWMFLKCYYEAFGAGGKIQHRLLLSRLDFTVAIVHGSTRHCRQEGLPGPIVRKCQVHPPRARRCPVPRHYVYEFAQIVSTIKIGRRHSTTWKTSLSKK